MERDLFRNETGISLNDAAESLRPILLAHPLAEKSIPSLRKVVTIIRQVISFEPDRFIVDPGQKGNQRIRLLSTAVSPLVAA